MKTQMMEITPAIAESMLAANVNNRRVSIRNLTFLTKEIKEGKWIENGATIVIHKDTGRLIDGQHRLTAVIEADTPIRSLVCYIDGNDQDAFLTVDTGKIRNHSDALVTHDPSIKNTSSIVGALRLIHMDTHTKREADALTNADICDLYDLYGSTLVTLVKTMHKSNLSKMLPPSPLLYCRFHTNKINSIKSDHFFDVLNTGMPSAPEDQAIIVLRDKLMQDRAEPVKMKREQLILCVKTAWNYYIAGKSLNFIRVGGRNPNIPFKSK